MPTDILTQLTGWITPKEAAGLLNVTPHQVRHLARTNVLEAQKFGYAWMVKRSDVETYATINRKPGPKIC